MTTARQLQQTQYVILALIAIQGSLLAMMFWKSPARVPAYLGFTPDGSGTWLAWGLAALTTVAYVWSASAISAVRYYLVRLDRLKLFALIVAMTAGVLEEVIFRKLLMDALAERGAGPVLQVLASALAFGASHVVWGIKSWSAGLNAVLSTTLLGAALGVVYLAGGRSLAPCVVAHTLITALIEPGLILAAVSNRIGLWRETPGSDDGADHATGTPGEGMNS